MWGGRGEVKVARVESRDQPDAGWLAATAYTFLIVLRSYSIPVPTS